MSFCINKGFSVHQDTPYQIVFDKQAGAGATFAQAMLTCQYCAPPRLRPGFTFIETGGQTRVVGSATMLSNSAAISEQPVPIQNAEVDADLLASAQAVQQGLSGMPAALPAATSPGVVNSPKASPRPVVLASVAASPAVSSAPVAFTNCSAARAAGAAPVRAGDAGYGSHLDRDGYGIGC